MTRLGHLWSDLRESFWFLPSLIIALSIALAVGLIEWDVTGNTSWMSAWPRLFGAGAEGARGMLSTIAGSMMTVVGVTFSMTLMTLVLASSQYTSRILRNFMRDRVTQVVLGIFAGIFIYCLIVLRTIRGGDEGEFIPSLAVTFGVFLAVGGISVLIYFIHHIASSIQASNIIASVAAETMAAIDRLFPDKFDQGPVNGEEEDSSPAAPKRIWQTIPAPVDGYIQRIDDAVLLRVAREYRSVVRMEQGIGEFVIRGTALASIALEVPPEDGLLAAIQGAYGISRHRTVEQDCAFGIRQIVDMALRALSPGINDTTTAVMCVEYLTAILSRLAMRSIPSSRRHDEGELRIIAIGPDFSSLVTEAFDQIRASAEGNIAMLLQLLCALQTIAGFTAGAGRRGVLREQMQWIAELGERTIASRYHRKLFEQRLSQTRDACAA